MLRRIFIGLLFAVFFGCESQVALSPKQLEESYLQATRKTELIAEERVQVVLIATYLNAFNAQEYPYDGSEVFFLDVYQSQQNGKGFFENGYTLSLENGEKPIKITQVSKEELQGLMRENATKWGEYYLVEFAPQSQYIKNSLQLFLSHQEFGENFLNFGFKALDKESLKDKK